MNRLKTHVNKGDIVRVTTGNHRGAEGKVLQVLRAENALDLGKEWKLVAGLRSDHMELDTTDLRGGVRMVKKHTRKSQEHPNGAIIEREGPIHISNVKRIEAADKKKESAKAKSKAK